MKARIFTGFCCACFNGSAVFSVDRNAAVQQQLMCKAIVLCSNH
jgi:hypothetical protein